MTNPIKTTSRLLSLDVLRGITIAGMILVNNPGSWGKIYAPLEHAEWNGLTPTDLVFPFFMFIMGVSMYLSYKKFDFKLSGQTFTKLLRRSVLLFLIGLAIGWFSLFCRGLVALRTEDLPFLDKILHAANNFENLRILGVLQRLALVSFFGSLIVLMFKPKRIPWLIGFILLFYWILMAMTGSYSENDSSLVSIIDRAVLGVTHMYSEHLPDGSKIIFDPEGLLSTLPCIAHVLLGFWAGRLISESKDNNQRIQKLFIFGTIIMFLGFLLNYGFPINKKIWSSSFVLATCGLASLLLALLVWIIDIKGKKQWSVFFESFGVNPMFIYVVAGIISILLGNIGFLYYGEWLSTKGFIYTQWLNPVFGDYLGSLVFALLFVSLNWMIGHILYKKKIYIKL
ncbi:MAG: heparan-alpha-glucosaminide N-acetyltransferase domain-containing protein [Paludibacter sp.]|nr:heparan-alpha-glucosaminide N-acetyltransferase domain-containing protein [Paludibacter sp.]